MGRATYEGRHTLHLFPEQHTMQAVVVVKLATGVIDFQGIANFSFAGGNIHVEQHLMQMLSEKYGAIHSIPAHSTVIFVGKWSPCQECTNYLIPGFLRHADVVARNIRVKFRFEQYYVTGVYPNAAADANLWPNQGRAQAAYTQISHAYPTTHRQNYSYNPDTRQVTDKLKRQVVFAPTHVDRTHEFETWHLD
ncbi:hypothetical protein [Pseudomonas halotolerans]|uniref:hypothetical protein n=1 Tax=Pseudomonas halotolerans TaxID=3143552 RepID=UPI0031D36E4C